MALYATVISVQMRPGKIREDESTSSLNEGKKKCLISKNKPLLSPKTEHYQIKFFPAILWQTDIEINLIWFKVHSTKFKWTTGMPQGKVAIKLLFYQWWSWVKKNKSLPTLTLKETCPWDPCKTKQGTFTKVKLGQNTSYLWQHLPHVWNMSATATVSVGLTLMLENFRKKDIINKNCSRGLKVNPQYLRSWHKQGSIKAYLCIYCISADNLLKENFWSSLWMKHAESEKKKLFLNKYKNNFVWGSVKTH